MLSDAPRAPHAYHAKAPPRALELEERVRLADSHWHLEGLYDLFVASDADDEKLLIGRWRRSVAMVAQLGDQLEPRRKLGLLGGEQSKRAPTRRNQPGHGNGDRR